jgi:release factor glutamine methyltransferase
MVPTKPLTLGYEGVECQLLPGVYPPSDDTFLLVDVAMNQFEGRQKILEVCCGAGLAALVVKREGINVVASDINPVACRNARLNGLEAVRTDLLEGFDGKFDLLLCNPPYLPSGEEERLANAKNPALDGGTDGLDVTRRLITDAPRVLDAGGILLFVASSLQSWDSIEDLLSSGNWEFEVAKSRRTFFEELRLYHCRRE